MELPHNAGRLFQQYLVDSYANIESQRLDWVRANQGKLRLDTLAGLLEFLDAESPDVAVPSTTSQIDKEPPPCHVSASHDSSAPMLARSPIGSFYLRRWVVVLELCTKHTLIPCVSFPITASLSILSP